MWKKSEKEFNGIVLGLSDVIEYYQLDHSKLAILTLNATFFIDAESHCEDMRAIMFDSIIENAQKFLST